MPNTFDANGYEPELLLLLGLSSAANAAEVEAARARMCAMLNLPAETPDEMLIAIGKTRNYNATSTRPPVAPQPQQKPSPQPGHPASQAKRHADPDELSQIPRRTQTGLQSLSSRSTRTNVQSLSSRNAQSNSLDDSVNVVETEKHTVDQAQSTRLKNMQSAMEEPTVAKPTGIVGFFRKLFGK